MEIQVPVDASCAMMNISDNTSQMNRRIARITPSAILSPVQPIRTHVTSFEQCAGLGTGEEGTASTFTSLASVVSFDMSSKVNALKQAYSAQINVYGNQNISNDDIEDYDEDEDDERVQKGRERNREHARKTRLRKKAQLQELELKYRSLLAEQQSLNQQLQDRNIAAILLGLSSSAPPASTCDISVLTTNSATEHESTSHHCATIGQKDQLRIQDFVMSSENCHIDKASSDSVRVSTRRKRGFPEVQIPINNAPLTININGVPTAISSKSHINWKTGMYCDEMGRKSQVTPKQLEDLRRERNRMHAKMTRDRKKCFISTMEKAIDELEKELECIRSYLLEGQSSSTSPESNYSKMVTPELTSRPSPSYSSAPSDDFESSNSADPSSFLVLSDQLERNDDDCQTKRTRHGFSLDG